MTDGELRPTDITERLVMETDRQIWGQGSSLRSLRTPSGF